MSSSESDEFEIIDQLEAGLSSEELAKVQAWLQPTDYNAQSSEFHRHLSSQAPGTGLWICETSKYQQWQKSADHGSLWIKGVPGAGKSVTAASMIEHLQKAEDTPVLYFFFRNIISANKRPRSLIKDFLAQLLAYSVRLQAILQPLLGTEIEDASDERLWGYLLVGLSSIKGAHCVVDALDEMELMPGDRFLERLNRLATFRPSTVKLLMTSRPKQYLQSALKDASIVHISLENDLVGKDINLFLSYRLKNHIPVGQQNLREALVYAISERSRGLFLYARLLLDQIIPSLESAQLDIEELVRNLPVGLEEMYNSMLLQQAKALGIDDQIQVFLLELATHSSRALRLNELASALAANFPPSTLPGSPKFVAKSACAPLLEISEDETVQVIHHSFTEFLLNSERLKIDKGSQTTQRQFPVLNSHQVHKRLSIICLGYLRSGGLRLENAVADHKPSKTFDISGELDSLNKKEDGFNYQEAKLRYPFLEYAMRNWAFHASKYDFDDDGFFQSVAGFLNPNSIDFKRWLGIEWTKGFKTSNSLEFQIPTPLHITAFSGLTNYAKKLIAGGHSVDLRDAEDRTPLHWACERGHISMVSLLLESGTDPDAEDCRGAKPIHEAARKNYSSIVKILLEAGVDPLTPKTRENVQRRVICGEISTIGETAVEYAYLQGHTETLMAMVPFLTPETVEDTFCQCCRYGKFEAAQAFLNSGLSPNAKSCGATALYLACRAQSVAIVELLLVKGADVHQTSEWKVKNRNGCGPRVKQEPLRSAIHGVVKDWTSSSNIACQQILRLLLNAGANIDVKDSQGDTPLLSLFPRHHSPDIVAVKGLLQAGANLLEVDKAGASVLHRYLESSSDIRTLTLLFEYGARADLLGGVSDDTILHIVLGNGSLRKDPQRGTTIVSLLLKNGARCDVENKHGVTAVEAAANSWGSYFETFATLLRTCPDMKVLRRCMWKIGSAKTKEGAVKFIRALQTLGVSLEDLDENGRTVLLTSIHNKILFEAFLECGSNLHAVDVKGRGVLHHYFASSPSRSTNEGIGRLVEMVSMGLDPKRVDDDGNTLLHVLAKIYEKKNGDDIFIQRLLDYGISINSRNKQGMTPIHVYLENWKFHSKTSTLGKCIDERFHERHEMSLLKAFQKSKESFDINAQDADGLTILHLAALRSETRLFYLLKEGADPGILTKERRNTLHLACRARQSNIVGYLCHNYNTMINHRDSYGRTPLHDACTSGRLESVRYLLKAGADVTIVDNNQRTPLHACAEFSDEQKLWILLARPNEVSGHILQDRFRPALQGSQCYYEPWYSPRQRGYPHKTPNQDNLGIGLIVKALLSAGCDVMATESSCQTPLDLAIQYDCQEMIQVLKFAVHLVQEKRGIKLEDPKLQTFIALKESSLPTMEEPAHQEIFQNPFTYLPFLSFGDVEWMSQNNGNITGFDEGKKISLSGHSLLYIAASNGLAHMVENFGPLARVNDDPEVVLARIQKHCSDSDYNPEIEYLAPALHMACARELSNMEVIESLVDKCGVDVNAHALVKQSQWAKLNESVKGGTALHALAKADYWWQLEALKYLLERGATSNSLNEKGETPLHIACTGPTYADMNCTQNTYGYWRIECVKILIEQGADINALDNDGLSCLHKAGSSPQIMRILLEHGADIALGKLSPIFPAIQIQCLETLAILLDAGVSPNAIDHSEGSQGFQLDYWLKDEPRTALFCTSFANLRNQQPKNSAPMVKLLIERGADTCIPFNGSDTLIHYIFQHAEFEIVCAFLDCASKFDFDTRDHLGRTVFLAACDWQEYLPGYQHKHWYPKEQAPFFRVLESGANPLVVDNDGRNALHHLLDNPDMEDEAIMQFLAHDSAKVLLNQRDRQGFTPLDCALRFLRPAVIEVLLSMGADLLNPDPTGATALHHIASQCLSVKAMSRKSSWGVDREPEFYSGLLTLWEKFLALGGSINVRDNNGSPPLFSYILSGQRDDYKAPENVCCHLESFATYFSGNADLDFHAKNKDGENALHIIARRENKNKKGDDAFQVGRVHENHVKNPKHNKELYEFIMRKGLNPLEEDQNGRSSLDIAAACEQKDILELFQYRK